MSVYKGEKLVAGGSIDTHFVRRPAWSQAVAISVADLTAGYKAPADGMIVGLLVKDGNTSSGISVFVNGVEVAGNKANVSDHILEVQCLVAKGDVITVMGDESPTESSIRFIPFEDSTVSDIEVVTPEYIRNQNILSDWENITISTSSSSPTVMPYDGFIYLGTGHNIILYINTAQFLISNHNNIAGNGACMVAVRKGDKVYINGDEDYTEKRVAYYKLRDYTGR